MKTLHVLFILGWLFISGNNPINANDTIKASGSHAIEIGFTPNLIASDLDIKRLTATVTKDSILFTLEYVSQKDRFLSFFSNKLKYFDHNGLKKSDTIVTFLIAKDKFKSLDHITMRFSTTERSRILEPDQNFIYLDKAFVKGLEKTITTNSNFSDFFAQYEKNNRIIEFKDVRWRNLYAYEEELTYEKITTLTFNKDSKFGNRSAEAKQVMTAGKNPGLGVRSLHEQGITGKGVRVAIIDQNLPGLHPEYKGRIVKYKDLHCKQPKNKGSMHGPGVLSLLAGDSIGTAPGALVYYAAAPSWTADARYQADALYWIIKENRRLPAGNKIKVVSVSAAPSGSGSPFKKNNNLWDEAVKIAEQEGIIVLDCTSDHGFIGPCFYDIGNPDDVRKCKVGWPDKVAKDSLGFSYIKVFSPCSGRTVAEEYRRGVNSYQYCGIAGLSWSIPYVAGVMAMGWQVKPEISGTEMVKMLIETASINSEGYKIINPVEFIRKLEQ
jgi:serine protease AprX